MIRRRTSIARTGLVLLALILCAPLMSTAFAFTNGQAASLVLGQPTFTSSATATNATSIGSPTGVAVDPATGKVFVSDSDNARVLRYASGAALVNGATAEAVLGQPNFTSSATATTASGLDNPRSLAIDSAGRLWVADANNSRVLRFDGAATKLNGANADGVLGQATFTSKLQPTTQSGMNQPRGVAVDSAGRLFVADTGNNRVLRFDNAAAKANGAAADGVLGQADFTTNATATSVSGMNNPRSVAVDSAGRLFVADTGNNRVLRSDAAATKANGAAADGVLGQATFTTNGQGFAANQLSTPSGVAVDSLGRLWVVDTNNNRAVRFDGAAAKANGAAADGVIGQPDFTTRFPDTTASGLSFPTNATVDSADNLWVADFSNNRVLRFDARIAQTITFGTLGPKTTAAAPFVVSATASSGLAVTFTTSTPAVCTVSGSTVTLVGVGTCTIAADQAGDTTYLAAAQVVQSFAVTKADQTITFGALGPKTVGDPAFAVNATATSGLPVSVASTTPAVCTVTGSTVTVVAAGTCTITASQAGNATYNAAPAVSQSFTVNPASSGTQTQTITFGALPAKTVGEPAFGVSATASSGLAVTFSSSTPAVCTVNGNIVTLVAAGTCTLTASQAGNASFSAATPVSQSFTVNPASTGTQAQTITWDQPLEPLVYGNTPVTLTATASSGLPVSYSTTTPTVCTVSGTILTIRSGGDCTLTADQPGNATYAAATPVTRTSTILRLPQAITFAALPTLGVGDAPITLRATVPSGLLVTFSSNTPETCTVSGNLLTPVAFGLCEITADQGGNASFRPAPSVVQSVLITASGTPRPRLYLPLATR